MPRYLNHVESSIKSWYLHVIVMMLTSKSASSIPSASGDDVSTTTPRKMQKDNQEPKYLFGPFSSASKLLHPWTTPIRISTKSL